MPLVRPGLWYGRPFSLVCSALERDTYLSHSLGRPWGCGFAFRADSLGQANPSKLMSNPFKTPQQPKDTRGRPAGHTHRGCSSPADALTLAVWS